jgi:hypothetical protein
MKLSIENYKPNLRCTECDMGMRAELEDDEDHLGQAIKTKCPHCNSELLITSKIQYSIITNKKGK